LPCGNWPALDTLADGKNILSHHWEANIYKYNVYPSLHNLTNGKGISTQHLRRIIRPIVAGKTWEKKEIVGLTAENLASSAWWFSAPEKKVPCYCTILWHSKEAEDSLDTINI
jgi:hypothetical protein